MQRLVKLQTLVIVVVTLCNFILVLPPFQSTSNKTISINGSLPLIVMASLFFGDEIEGRLGEMPANCPFKCQVLGHASSFFDDVVERASAIVVHNYATDLVPTYRRLKHHQTPRWVLLNLETVDTLNRISDHPLEYGRRLDGLFDWIISYRKDADVFAPYGQILRFEPTVSGHYGLERYQKAKTFPKFKSENFQTKKKHIAAVISNCDDSYGRITSLNKLAELGLSVDIYGKCSPSGLKCPGRMSNECYKILEKNYFFYASFENSLCRDYVTEKFFNILDYDVVPLVMNGANMTELWNVPAESHINARSFSSMESLAKYLLEVSNHLDRYSSFFRWKGHSQMVEDETLLPMCGLCKKIHQTSKIERSKRRLATWLKDDSKCSNVIL